MVIQHNMAAINANRTNGIVGKKNVKIAEKLSSGYRINRSADDAAGLAISEKMRRQIRGLTQASMNAQDGVSMAQSAEGAMNEMHDIVHRGTELAIKAANGTLTDADRLMVDEEIQQLKNALDETAHTTVFNEMKLFPDEGTPIRANNEKAYHYDVNFNLKNRNFTIAYPADAGSGVGGSSGTGQVLADKIANEFVPNAVSQIFDAFPALETAVGSDTIQMALDISYLDGPSNTLAYAQCSFYSTGKPFGFLIKVDSADFTDADVQGSKAEMLESTLAHELMHSVMQYTMTDGMTGRNGNEEFPMWFTEGTAQLTGGGYTTGWNDALTYYTEQLTNENDTSADATIENYLKQYTVAGRPYGHGYLASAYLGYLASGQTDISSAAIANGMNKIFDEILTGSSLFDAISSTTGLAVNSTADIESLFANGDADLVEFVRKLSYKTGDGAGSVITSSLDVGGTNILGDTASTQAFAVDSNQIKVDMNSSGGVLGTVTKTVRLHVGVEAGIGIDMDLFDMDAKALGLENTNVKTADDAETAISEFKSAVEIISSVRSYYGAIQNRLEHTINNLDNVVENTTAAESRIRDTDMAQAMVELSSNQILQQAGQAILSQANRNGELVLGLLG